MKTKWKLNERKFEKTGVRTYHKARTPGVVRKTRMPGGSGYRGDKAWLGNRVIDYRD